jgi:hypothetical protein
MPTIKFVVDGQDLVVDADRVVRDSQQYVAERREAGQWLTVASWPRGSVTSVLRKIDGPEARWFPEDVRTSAGLQHWWGDPPAVTRLDPLPAKSWVWGHRWLTRSARGHDPARRRR